MPVMFLLFILCTQLREKGRQVVSLEEQVQDKTAQCTNQMGKIKELDGEIGAREGESQTLHRELRELQSGASIATDDRERIQKLHQEHCKDYQKQIEIVSTCALYSNSSNCKYLCIVFQ